MNINDEKGEATWLESIKKDRPNNYKPCTTTIELQKKNHSSQVIIRAVRKFIEKKRKGELVHTKKQAIRLATFDEEDFNSYD